MYDEVILLELDINGTPPELAGKCCEALMCEQYMYRGKLMASANVTYLRFAGIWHRLYFDGGIIFWRIAYEEPKPRSVPEKQWDYPHIDVGRETGVVGVVLSSYEMIPTPFGAKVELLFANGRRIVLEEAGEVTNYTVI